MQNRTPRKPVEVSPVSLDRLGSLDAQATPQGIRYPLSHMIEDNATRIRGVTRPNKPCRSQETSAWVKLPTPNPPRVDTSSRTAQARTSTFHFARSDRDQPLNAEQIALLRPLPKEQNALPLTKGAVFFAHNAESADGGVAALGIVLGNAEHLTGRYTVFARVTEGLDVLDELASAPIDHEDRPEVHLGISGAQFIDASEVPTLRLPRRSVCSALLAQTESGLRRELAALISTLLFGVGALALLGRRASEQLLRASRLLVLLVSSFGLLVVLYPVGLRSPTVATGLFLCLVGLFKLMSRFEAERS